MNGIIRNILSKALLPVGRQLSLTTHSTLPNYNVTQQQQPYGTTTTPFAEDDGHRVEVCGQNWPHSIHLPHTWLRDHCRCPQCYSAATQQRTFDVASLHLAIRPCSVKLDKQVLQLTWPDGHQSSYSLQFLWQNSCQLRATTTTSGSKDSGGEKKKTWAAAGCPALDRITVKRDSIVDGGPGLKTLVQCLEKYGLGVVSEVAPTIEATEAVVTAVAPVERTFFGGMWSFTANLQRSDSAYSTDTLGAHTDGTYFTQPARLQVFHCLEAARVGGDTLLVDGFHVAARLKEKHPRAYEFFSTKAVPGEYIGDGQHHRSVHTVLSHQPVTGTLDQIRYNLYDRAPVSTLGVRDVELYYQHLRDLTKLVNDTRNEVWLKLMPGSVLFIDNWRVMHGRAGYTGSRTMAGCYVGNEDYTSAARTLGVL